MKASVPNRRPCGAKPSPRHVLAGATPHRIAGDTPPQRIAIPVKLSMWNNDQYGCCVTSEEAFNKAASGVFISDAEVLQWAQDHGVADGAVISDVLDQFAVHGFDQDGNVYNDGGKASIDYTNRAALTNAISKGAVKIGVAAGQLQNAVGSSNGWFAVNFRRDPNLNHCVSLCGYGPIAWLAQQLGVSVPDSVDGSAFGYALFTWNTIGIIDEPSLQAITGEAWLRTPNSITVGNNPPTPDPVVVVPAPTPGPGPGPKPGPAPTPSGPTEAEVQGAVDALWQHRRVVTKGAIDAAIRQAFAGHGLHAAGGFNFWAVLAKVEALVKQYGPAALPEIEALVNASSLSPAQKAAIDAVLSALPGGALAA